jgi:hypothetical protein
MDIGATFMSSPIPSVANPLGFKISLPRDGARSAAFSSPMRSESRVSAESGCRWT